MPKDLFMRDGVATNGTWTQLGSRIQGTSMTYWPPLDEWMLFFAEDEGRYFKGRWDGEAVLDEGDNPHAEWAFLWCAALAPIDHSV